MKIFYRTLLLLLVFFVFVAVVAISIKYYPGIVETSHTLNPRQIEKANQRRATFLVKRKNRGWIKSHIESLTGYVELQGWDAHKISQKPGLFKDYYAEEVKGVDWLDSTYIVSYTYSTANDIVKGSVYGWWWEVILGENIVRQLDIRVWEKGKSLVDSLRTPRLEDFFSHPESLHQSGENKEP
jgi:hypothetical protein